MTPRITIPYGFLSGIPDTRKGHPVRTAHQQAERCRPWSEATFGGCTNFEIQHQADHERGTWDGVATCGRWFLQGSGGGTPESTNFRILSVTMSFFLSCSRFVFLFAGFQSGKPKRKTGGAGFSDPPKRSPVSRVVSASGLELPEPPEVPPAEPSPPELAAPLGGRELARGRSGCRNRSPRWFRPFS